MIPVLSLESLPNILEENARERAEIQSNASQPTLPSVEGDHGPRSVLHFKYLV